MKFTKNLGLTQYQSNDTLSWRDRYNTDMRTIDAATSSTSAFVEELVDNMDKYNDKIEAEIERLDLADDEQKRTTASVLAFAQKEALTREEEDNKLRTEMQATTTSVMSSTVELIDTLAENVTKELSNIKKDVDKNSLHNLQDDSRLDALEDLTGNYGQITAQIQSNTSSIAAMKVRLSKAEEQIVDQGTVIGEIQTEQATADMRIESLEQTTSAHADAISDINDLLTSYQPTIQTVSILNRRMNVVEETVHDQEDEISEVRSLAQQANQVASDASSSADRIDGTVNGIVLQVDEIQQTTNSALAAANNARTIADKANGNASDALSNAAVAKASADKAQDAVDALEGTVEQNSDKLANVTGAPIINAVSGGLQYGVALGVLASPGGVKRVVIFEDSGNISNMPAAATDIIVEFRSGKVHGNPAERYINIYNMLVESTGRVSIQPDSGNDIILLPRTSELYSTFTLSGAATIQTGVSETILNGTFEGNTNSSDLLGTTFICDGEDLALILIAMTNSSATFIAVAPTSTLLRAGAILESHRLRG